ncbi:MAG TPA: hypothetical protein EYQ50_27140 [Verrucomicrobiales bacterium]|nr:hypothetical protein [Verrucomicrobiales bacterium]
MEKKTSPYTILKTLKEDLILLPLGPRTQTLYWNSVRQLSEHFEKSPDQLSVEEIRPYFIFLKVKKRSLAKPQPKRSVPSRFSGKRHFNENGPHS